MVVCPDCGGKRFFAHKYYAAKAMKKGAYCRYCANKGERCYKYGQPLTQETKDKIRACLKNVVESVYNKNLALMVLPKAPLQKCF